MSDPLPSERHAHILQRLRNEGRVLSAVLAVQFGVSEDSIRRDLRELAAQGLCRRVHGGALPVTPHYAPLHQRHGQAPCRKQALARCAVAQLGHAQSLLLDAGSTNSALASALPPGAALQIVTNAPDIALRLLDHPGAEVTLLGGRLHKRSGALVGAQALQALQLLRADIACVGVCAVDAEGGLWAIDAEEAVLKREMRARADRHLFVVANEKLGAVASFRIGELDAHSVLICEHDAPAAFVRALQTRGLQVLRAAAAPA